VLVSVGFQSIVYEIAMTVRAPLFISRARIQNRTMCKHSAPLLRNIEDISMTFLTLRVLDGFVGPFTIAIMVVRILDEMGHHILDAV